MSAVQNNERIFGDDLKSPRPKIFTQPLLDTLQCDFSLRFAKEFAASHHAKGGNILASLDNFLAETVEGSRVPFAPHGKPGQQLVNGMASANTGCRQCHGSKVALVSKEGDPVTVDGATRVQCGS